MSDILKNFFNFKVVIFIDTSTPWDSDSIVY